MGQTKRDLKSRVAEHKRAVKNAEPEKSASCEHLMLFDHRINWEESTVLKYVNNCNNKSIKMFFLTFAGQSFNILIVLRASGLKATSSEA